ncbi:hypothetical protein E4T50_07376 [Aureobasidium sp. EXF-12298]|nr:hypothetical protein E4T50_07376 [Aureobasidium sp. EXF-12298]KAI4755097.1 hypothetical protein E4T51_11805 [Aureobasidium sp. EXF-12344]KAI4779610.1 hypothetical protein E4T52_05473 [Aureobasidium sp. EXF-3400]
MDVDPVLDNDKLSASHDLEMAEQQEVDDLVRQGMSQEEQEAYDLETKGYCITSWKQVCSAGEVAKARRERAERQQQKKDKNVASYNRNNERVIQKKSCEIQDLCARINQLKRDNQLEIEKKNLEIQSQYLKISELNTTQKEMKREHQAELESLEQMQALLLADLREWCQVNDEEVEALKETIDRQALPPAYADINNKLQIPRATDDGPADARTVISSAITSLREVIADPEPARHTNPVIHVANVLHTSLRTIERGHKTKLWPRSTTALALHAVHECVDRVIMYLTIHPELYAHLPLSPRFLSRVSGMAKRAHTALRKAFAAADTLALELCSLHFASGGRRAQLAASASRSIVPTPHSMLDTNDDFLDLQYWKKRFEGVRQEALEWKREVGVVVFDDTVTWLEHTILSTI